MGDPADIPGAIPEDDFTQGGDANHYADGGAAMDPADMPGAIPEQGQTANASADPADMAGAVPEEEYNHATYGTPGQQAIAYGEGAVRGVLGKSITNAIETGSGITTPEAIQGREEENALGAGAAEWGTFGASMLLGKGPLALVGKAGELAMGLTHTGQVIQEIEKAGKLAKLTAPVIASRIKDATTLSGRFGAAATQVLTEAGILGADTELSKQILYDPATASQSAMADHEHPLSNILWDAAIGGATGGAIGAVSPLISKNAPRVAKFFEDLKGAAASTNPATRAENFADELNVRLQQAKEVSRGQYGENGIKTRAIREVLSGKADEKMVKSTEGILASLDKKIAANPENRTLQSIRDEFAAKVVKPEASPADSYLARESEKATGVPTPNASPDSSHLYESMDYLKRRLGEDAHFNKDLGRFSLDEKEHVRAVRDLYAGVKDVLQDEGTWGKAAKIQKDINEAVSKAIDPIRLAEKTFTKEAIDPVTGRLIDEADLGKAQTIVNQLGTTRGSRNEEILKAFLKHTDNLFSVVNDAHGLSEESLIAPSSTATLDKYLNNYNPANKLIDALYNKGPYSFGSAAAALLGDRAGAIIGQEMPRWLTTYLGEKAFGPLFSKMLPTVMKTILKAGANASGIRAVGRYITRVADGNELMSKGAKNLFKGSAEIIPLHAVPSLRRLERLDKALVASNDNPDKFGQNLSNGSLAHYMPDNATAMSQTVANASQYLNGLRPKIEPTSPLDGKRTPSSIEDAKYKNALTIAEQPMMVMQKIAMGTVTVEDLQHLNNLYPGAYNQMKKEVGQALTDHLSKGKAVPYQTALGLSMFTGQAMHSSMLPQNIMAAQPVPPQGSSPGRKGGNGKGLNKLASSHMTASQSREAREQGQRR